mmetsp:Transcript_177620/g.432135  ORF Transcript_177620/g.432135 Transcript_177620/m.432135 type:complete len:211 (+) Transcript_177620:1822-2454(+)
MTTALTAVAPARAPSGAHGLRRRLAAPARAHRRPAPRVSQLAALPRSVPAGRRRAAAPKPRKKTSRKRCRWMPRRLAAQNSLSVARAVLAGEGPRALARVGPALLALRGRGRRVAVRRAARPLLQMTRIWLAAAEAPAQGPVAAPALSPRSWRLTRLAASTSGSPRRCPSCSARSASALWPRPSSSARWEALFRARKSMACSRPWRPRTR